MARLFVILTTIILCFQLSVLKVEASFGVSPADITFEHLTPGMTIEKEFLLSRTDIEDDVQVVVESDIEGADDWIRIEPGVAFTLAKGERTKKMKVLISVPEDVTDESYQGYIFVKIFKGQEGSGVSLVKGVGLAVNLLVVEFEVKRLVVRKMEISDITKGKPIRLFLTIENQGNKDSVPDEVRIIVYDMSGKRLFEKKTGFYEKVGPTKTQELLSEFDNDLTTGQYSADVAVIFQEKPLREDKIVFEVKEPGADEKASNFAKIAIIYLSAVGIAIAIVALSVNFVKRIRKRV